MHGHYDIVVKYYTATTSSDKQHTWDLGLIVGVSCLLCSSAMPGVARRLELSPCNTCEYINVCMHV